MVDSTPWLLVGLGNPGREYAGNRHNVGFMVVSRWVSNHATPGTQPWREKFHGLYATANTDAGRCVALMPQTYMNRSGKSVAAAATFFQIPPKRVVVVHDELDFPFGRVAVKSGGGHGGHNGLRDIVAVLGSRDFVRVRTGIGRPSRGDVSSWVLSDFSDGDFVELPGVIDRAQLAATRIMTVGPAKAMNEFNQTSPEGGDSASN